MIAAALPALRRHSGALIIVVVYFAFAGLWILLSDYLISLVVGDPGTFGLLSSIKGLLFVAVTAGLLYGLLRRRMTVVEVAAPPWPWLSLLVLAVTIAAVTALVIVHHTAEQRQLEIARLQAIAALKARHIADWLRERQLDAYLIQTSPYLAESYRAWQADRKPATWAKIIARLEQFRRNRFDSVLLFAPDGALLWHSTASPGEVPQEVVQSVAAAARTGHIQRVGPYRDAGEYIHLDFVVPLMIEQTLGAVIILHSDPAEWIYPTLAVWPVPSTSAEALLFRRDGDAVLYLNPLRHHPDGVLHVRLPLATERLISARVLRGEVAPGTVVEGTDYRGAAVFGVAQPVPDTDWWLLAKIDRAELHARVRATTVWIATIGVLLVLALGSALVLWRQHETLQRTLALHHIQAERLAALAAQRASDTRFYALVEQAPAGIYLWSDGRLQYVNPACAAIFGAAAPAEFIGVNLIEWIVPEDRARVAAELERSVAASTTFRCFCAGLHRAGHRIELELYGRGFHDDAQGQPAVIGFLSDISARVAAERAVRRQAAQLAARNAELERFNRVSVGRELVMIALKRRVNELARQLGQPPPFDLHFLEDEPRCAGTRGDGAHHEHRQPL